MNVKHQQNIELLKVPLFLIALNELVELTVKLT